VLSVRTLQPQAQVRAVWADGTALARIETIVAGDADKAIDPGEPWA